MAERKLCRTKRVNDLKIFGTTPLCTLCTKYGLDVSIATFLSVDRSYAEFVVGEMSRSA